MWLNKPFLRGTLALIDAMALGMKALTYAANVQAADQPGEDSQDARAAGAVDLAMGEGMPQKATGGESQTINGIAIGATTVLALVLGFGLFWTLPALADGQTAATPRAPAHGGQSAGREPGRRRHPAGHLLSCTSG